MKVQFIGSGSAFTLENWQNNALVISHTGKMLMIDCGGDARHAMRQCGYSHRSPDAVYVSHLHTDHIGGLEWLAFNRYFDPGAGPHPKLFAVRTLMQELWENSLKGGLKSIEGKSMTLTDYFQCHALEPNSWFDWEGIRFIPVQTVHVEDGFTIVNSYGLFILPVPPLTPPNWNLFDHRKAMGNYHPPCVFYTSDTQFCPNQLSGFYNLADVIFHDCETSPFKSKVHAHYSDLFSLPEPIRKRIFLMHCQDGPKQDPTKDGFAGFVQRGQTFDFTVKPMEPFVLKVTMPDPAPSQRPQDSHVESVKST